jgi:hypothetical protein
MKGYIASMAFIVGVFVLSAEGNASESFCDSELRQFGALYEMSDNTDRARLKEQVETRWRTAPFLSEEQVKASYLAMMADWIDQGHRNTRGIVIGCYNDFGE